MYTARYKLLPEPSGRRRRGGDGDADVYGLDGDGWACGEPLRDPDASRPRLVDAGDRVWVQNCGQARPCGVVRLSVERDRSMEFLPLLSRGKHRRPRSGACLMEYTSYLAGERWSDHPACTHPLLGELARQVNDFIPDEARQALIEVVPEMVGLSGADLRIDVRIALQAAQTALPVAAEETQRIMAVAVLTCERLMADLDGCPGVPLSRRSSDALARAPLAAGWARRYTRNLSISRRAFRRQTAPAIVRYAVQGIARACIPDPGALLHGLLVRAIDDCKALQSPQGSTGTARSRRTAEIDPPNATTAGVEVVSSSAMV